MAARFWRGTTSVNYTDTNNWSSTSGGATPASTPTSADDVTFDGGGNNPCTIDTAAQAAKTLTVASGYTNTVTFTNNLAVSGSITIANSAHTFTGAGLLRMITTGTWTTNGKTIAVPVEIGGGVGFTCTLAQALTISGALTLTATTSTTFSGAFLLTADSCTISGTQTVTIVNDVQITNLTTIADANIINGSGKNWKTGGLTTTGGLTGTATVVLNGTGTWQGAATCQINLTINTAGTATLSGAVRYSGGTLTYTAGTVVVTGVTLTITTAACTLDTNGIVWPDVSWTPGATGTLTLNSLLSVSGTFTLPNFAGTFAGTAGFTIGTLTNTSFSANRIFTFTAGNTYTITTALSTVQASGIRVSYVSSSPGSKVNWVLRASATQDILFLDPTDQDASGGWAIFTCRGTVTTSPNWISVYPLPAPIGGTYGPQQGVARGGNW